MAKINKLTIIASVIAVLISLGILSRINNSSDTLIGLIGAIILTFFAIKISIKRSSSSKILMASFVIRLIMAFVFTFVLNDADPDAYGNTASQLMTYGFPGLLTHIPMGAHFYSGIVSIVWSLFGESYLLIRVINAFISFYSCAVFNDIILKLYGEKTKQVLLPIVCFLPTLLRFSSTFPNRESLLVLLLMLSVKNLYTFYKTNRMLSALISIGLIAVATILHIISIGLLAVLAGILIAKSKNTLGFISLVFFIGLSIGLSAFMLQNNVGTEKLNLYSNESGNDRIAAYQNGGAIGRAEYLNGISDGSIMTMVITLPVRVIYFLFAPFIWMIRSPLDLLGFIDTLFYVFFSFCIYKGYRYMRENSRRGKYFQITLLLALIVMLVMFGLVISNYGTALRHRAKLVMIFAILSGPYIQKYIETRRRICIKQ